MKSGVSTDRPRRGGRLRFVRAVGLRLPVEGFAGDQSQTNSETHSMASIKLLLAPIRRVIAFPLVQLAITVGVILWLQSASDNSVLGPIYNALDGARRGVRVALHGDLRHKSLHPIMARDRALDRLCLPRRTGDPFRRQDPRHGRGRTRRALQCVLSAQRDRARTRHRSLPRLASWNTSLRRIFRRKNGKRPSPGPRTTGRLIRR